MLSARRRGSELKRLGVAVPLLSLALTGACTRNPTVGVVLPETGAVASYGAAIKSGVKLAFDDAVTSRLAQAGVAVEYRDSCSDPVRGASEAEALYSSGAIAVIGGTTTAEARAMIPVAARRERVLISPSASAPELAHLSPFFFRVFPSDELEGVKAADFLTHNLGVRSVLIVQEDNPYTRGLLPVFIGRLRTGGGTVSGSVNVREEGWETALRQGLSASRPTGVYLCGYGDAITETLRILRSVAYSGTICTTSAISSATVLQRAGGLAEGVVFPLAGLDVTSKEEPVRSFARRYYEAYKLFPDTYAAHGYDAALAVIYALGATSRLTGLELQRCLRGLGDKRGVTGVLSFDEFGNIDHLPSMHRIHDGKVEGCEDLAAPGEERSRQGRLGPLPGRAN